MNSGYSNEAYPAQPWGPREVQHTIVNVSSEPPKDHLVWSLWSFVYGNICCFGLAALIFSVKARDRKVVGDQDGAQEYASTARWLNIVATVLASGSVDPTMGHLIHNIDISKPFTYMMPHTSTHACLEK
ncbi:dispanin subfamily A member 2b-like [Anableps anableps]